MLWGPGGEHCHGLATSLFSQLLSVCSHDLAPSALQTKLVRAYHPMDTGLMGTAPQSHRKPGWASPLNTLPCNPATMLRLSHSRHSAFSWQPLYGAGSHLAISNRDQRPGPGEEGREMRTGSLCSPHPASAVFPALAQAQRLLEVTRAEALKPNPQRPPTLTLYPYTRTC